MWKLPSLRPTLPVTLALVLAAGVVGLTCYDPGRLIRQRPPHAPAGRPVAAASNQAPRGEGYARAGSAGQEEKGSLSGAYGRLPLSFERNEGQLGRGVSFAACGDGYGLFLSAQEAVLLLRGGGRGGRGTARAAAGAETAAVTMRLEGANPKAHGAGERELPGRINYLSGRDERRWRRSVPAFAAVRYEEVYPGVDLVYYGNQRQLEYDFQLAPGADPQSIRLRFDGGGGRAEVDASGELVLRTEAGEVRQSKPVVYQEAGGARREVAGA